MSTYVYHCDHCGRTFEHNETIHEHQQHPQIKCPHCGSKAVHQVPASFQAVTSRKA